MLEGLDVDPINGRCRQIGLIRKQLLCMAVPDGQAVQCDPEAPRYNDREAAHGVPPFERFSGGESCSNCWK